MSHSEREGGGDEAAPNHYLLTWYAFTLSFIMSGTLHGNIEQCKRSTVNAVLQYTSLSAPQQTIAMVTFVIDFCCGMQIKSPINSLGGGGRR